MEQTIIQLLWQRKEEAIAALSQAFGKRLFQTAMNIIGIREDAEESVSDTYLAVWNTIPPQKPQPLGPFVYRIGRNLALKRQRHNSAQKRSGYDLSLDELSGCIAGPDFWATLDARALGQAIDRFLDQIPQENRVIFLRRYWFGDGVQEIARQLSLSEGAVSLRLRRTREKLKAYLKQEGFYE